MSYLLSRLVLARGASGNPFGKVTLKSFSSLHISKGTPALLGNLSDSHNKKTLPSKLSIQPARLSSHGDHVALWTAEKIFSGILVPVIPLALMFPTPALDYLMAFVITVHSHWGIEAIVVDYVRESVFGSVIPKIGVALVYALSAMTLGGLCYFTYTDVGLANAVRMLWKL